MKNSNVGKSSQECDIPAVYHRQEASGGIPWEYITQQSRNTIGRRHTKQSYLFVFILKPVTIGTKRPN